MKNQLKLSVALVAAVLLLVGCRHCCTTCSSGHAAAPIPPAKILATMQSVADWQLANPATNAGTGWIPAVSDAGFMAIAGISGDVKYRDTMLALGETNHWQLGTLQYDADGHCIGQAYAELYALYRERRMIAPLREKFDAILANPSVVSSLQFDRSSRATQGKSRENWSWCDSLFMGPPTWVRLASLTGDSRYLDFAVTNWWRTTDYLYDKDQHLFSRDSSYFDKKEANGKKVFWSRGNGWVLAGLIRTLQYLPTNHPDRPRLEKLFKELAGAILACQQSDGLWRASLLDPASYPLPETSGSGLFTYALAWGVNQGLLDRTKYEPAVEKAWAALAGCVDADGKLTHVQPVGGAPKKFNEDSTQPYGAGAFLLAGSEMYHLEVLKAAKTLALHVFNPASFNRETETVEFNRSSLRAALAAGDIAVMDGLTSRIVPSQIYSPDTNQLVQKLLFQVDLAPREGRMFYLVPVTALAAVPTPLIKTFARYVPERYDDFAWESDRIAHRAYGIPLIKAEGTISSAPDVWIKTYRNLMINEMYASGHYHMDNGDEMDDYRVGHSRGCGGVGIWDGKKLYTSSNWHHWNLITTGPIRSEFELTYDAWDAGSGRMVSETKRYPIDAGSWLTRAQSTFASDDATPLTVGVGLAERACPSDREQFIAQDQAAGWMAYWQPEDKPKGVIGDAIILAKGSVEAFTNDAPDLPEAKLHAQVPQPTHEGYPPIRDLLAITKVGVGQPLTYYFGACWDRSGDFTNHLQWEAYVQRFAERRDQPLSVKVGK